MSSIHRTCQEDTEAYQRNLRRLEKKTIKLNLKTNFYVQNQQFFNYFSRLLWGMNVLHEKQLYYVWM